jgi:transposase
VTRGAIMGKKMKSYDERFKFDAVQLYLKSGKSFAKLGNELGVAGATLSNWVNNPKYNKAGTADVVSLEELRKLRKELSIVKEERDILKKVVAIFS